MAVSVANKMVMIIMAILMIQSVLSAKCSKKAPNEGYSKQVVEVVSNLQVTAPRNGLAATSTSNKGDVTGSASCTSAKSGVAARDDCSTCLGVAIVELTTGNCKGKKTGSSSGNTASGLDGTCTMSFSPA